MRLFWLFVVAVLVAGSCTSGTMTTSPATSVPVTAALVESTSTSVASTANVVGTDPPSVERAAPATDPATPRLVEPCDARSVRIASVGDPQGSTGNFFWNVPITNTSTTACSMVTITKLTALNDSGVRVPMVIPDNGLHAPLTVASGQTILLQFFVLIFCYPQPGETAHRFGDLIAETSVGTIEVPNFLHDLCNTNIGESIDPAG
jgi:hypothetical protein